MRVTWASCIFLLGCNALFGVDALDFSGPAGGGSGTTGTTSTTESTAGMGGVGATGGAGAQGGTTRGTGGAGATGGGGGAPLQCGDGKVTAPEACDDGNLADGDGCTGCSVDVGYECTGQPSTCKYVATVAQATNLGISLVSDTYDGTLGSMKCAPLVLQTADTKVKRVWLETGIDHTYVGDLVLKLVSPSNITVTLMSRPGLAEQADDGNDDTKGEASNLTPEAPILFYDGAPHDAEAIGSKIGDGQEACKDDGWCDYDPNPGAAQGNGLSDLNGTNPNGSWQFCVGDAAPLNAGALWSVVLTVISE